MKNKKHLSEKDLLAIKRMRLLDDEFMRIVFDNNKEATELILRIILDKPDLTVLQVKGRREIKSLGGHSVILDIEATDSTNKVYDIEIQRNDSGVGARRARYYSSMLDTTLLRKNEDYDKLTDAYVIFITENDTFDKNFPVYNINRKIEQTGELFDDGSYIIYVNGAYKDDKTNIGKLLHDFRTASPSDMNFAVLADRVRYFKEYEGGHDNMGSVFDEIRKEAAEKAVAEERARAASVFDEIRKEAAEERARAAEEKDKAIAEERAKTNRERAKAEQEKILLVIETYREIEMGKEDILSKIMKRFNLTEDKALEYYSQVA